MQLKNIKVGGVYAFIEGYSQFSRPGRCFTNPDAQPIKIVSKKRVLVAQGKDSCGRDTDRKETVVVYKRYDIPASHMLAMDLDIIDEKHPELVTQVVGLKGKDVVWDWSKEVEKVREDHRIQRLMDRYFDYVAGLRSRVIQWLMADYGLTELRTAPVFLTRMYSGERGIDPDLKVWLYDTICGENDPDALIFNGPSYNRYGHHHQYDVVPFLPTGSTLTAAVHIHMRRAVKKLNPPNARERGECSVDVSLQFDISLRKAFLRDLDCVEYEQTINQLYYNEANKPRFQALYNKCLNHYQELDTQGRLEIVARALNTLRADVLKVFPNKTLPTFTAKSWKTWSKAEEQKFEAMLPKAEPEK